MDASSLHAGLSRARVSMERMSCRKHVSHGGASLSNYSSLSQSCQLKGLRRQQGQESRWRCQVLSTSEQAEKDSESIKREFDNVPFEIPETPFPSCPKWRRVMLKVSGEALQGDGKNNVGPMVTSAIAKEVALIQRLGVEVAIVVGGGNFFRGASWVGASGLDRASADHIGMLATVMNAIFLQASMESIGIETRVMTAFKMSEVAEPYIRRRAIRHLEKGRVVIFAAGTGNPFFTTDSAAALRAAEIGAEVVLKGTNVDGVYDSDPRKNANAKLFKRLTHREVTLKNLQVMDITAITLCFENKIPVVVFNLNEPGNITKALSGEPIGTVIEAEEDEQ